MALQQTIATVTGCVGVGVHSGAPARLTFRPAPAGTGVVFVRTDLTAADRCVPAQAAFVVSAQNGTTLRNAAGVEVATVEHLMAAVAAAGIDNLFVELSGPEVPILDGSAEPFLRLLSAAGVRPQSAPQRRLRVLAPVRVEDGAKWAALHPEIDGREALSLDVTIRFRDPAIGVQRRAFTLEPRGFRDAIAAARTFGFLADLEHLRAQKLALGASLENTVAVAEGRVVNPEGLRYEDEFVRHKILDAVGDLALAGAPIVGRFVADQPGHALNVKLVQALLATPAAYVVETNAEALAAVG